MGKFLLLDTQKRVLYRAPERQPLGVQIAGALSIL
jgi:hypothetical protein